MAVQFTKVTVKGFKKCCIPNAVYKTDGGMLRHGSKGDGNVKSQGEEDDGTDCDDGNSDTDWNR